MSDIDPKTSQMATVEKLMQTIFLERFSPVPTPVTLRRWLKRAGIPRFKSNPGAKHGGGKVFYSVAAVERWLSTRIEA